MLKVVTIHHVISTTLIVTGSQRELYQSQIICDVVSKELNLAQDHIYDYEHHCVVAKYM